MKRVLAKLDRRGSSQERTADESDQSPEAVIVREVKRFCESGKEGSAATGDEYLHLPAIVEAAESSPSAAAAACYTIRKLLAENNNSRKRSPMQYNTIMLVRILTDHPGPSFTKNMDKKFVETVRSCLLMESDLSVQHLLRETLDVFAHKQATREDPGLSALLEMWTKQKEKNEKNLRLYRPPPAHRRGDYGAQRPPPPFQPSQIALPNPGELAARIEESRTTAKLLSQVLQSTPQSELLQNDLVKEFADRCTSASTSVQIYMRATNPEPDPRTMETLIETGELLNLSLNRYQRAVLQARRAMGDQSAPSPPPVPERPAAGNAGATNGGSGNGNTFTPPPGPPSSAARKDLPAPTAATATTAEDSTLAKSLSNEFAPPPGPPPKTTNANSYNNSHSYNDSFVIADPFADENELGDSSTRAEEEERRDRVGVAIGGSGSGSSKETPGGLMSTPSYVKRQDSAVGNVTMHGGS